MKNNNYTEIENPTGAQENTQDHMKTNSDGEELETVFEEPECEHDIIFWGSPGDVSLSNIDFDDAVEKQLGQYGPGEPLPDIVEVAGFVRMRPSVDAERDILEGLLEHLDEEYGDPNGGYTEPTTKMKEAAEALAKVVEQEYEPWACEEVIRVNVNVAQWCAKN